HDEIDHRTDVHPYRAQLDATRLGALDTAGGFLLCLFGREAKVYLDEIVRAHLRVLLGDSLTRQLDAFFVGQRIVAGRLIAHRTPPPQARRIADAWPCSLAMFSAPLLDRPATARCSGAPARGTCCCVGSGPRS